MIDKDVFANLMGLLAGMTRYDVESPVLQAYYVILSPRLTTAEFQQAMQKVMEAERFWPSPAVILEKAGRDTEALSQSAFRDVTEALANHGGYRFLPVEISTGWDAPTWAGIKAIGGLREISECTEQRWPGLIKRFCKAYQEALAPQASLPDRTDRRVRQLTAQTAKDMAITKGDR